MANEGRDDNVVMVESIEQTMKQRAATLNNSAGTECCCIFRVPQSLVDINKKAYHPHILSIGPYHHGKEQRLNMIQDHKWRFLREMLGRTPPTGRTLADYLGIVASMVPKIKECYSETIDFSTQDLVQMMVLDGFFILELFSKVGKVVDIKPDDPIFKMAWVLPFLSRDLLQLENQIPFFLLQKLFDESKDTRPVSNSSSLPKLILGFFNCLVERSDKVLARYHNLTGKHLLDFFRLSFISEPTSHEMRVGNINLISGTQSLVPPMRSIEDRENSTPFILLIQPAKKLHIAGIKFETMKADSFLDIKFCKGVLKIPYIKMDAFTSSLFLNCVAFEQCYSHHCTNHITAYITFMGCLLNTPGDAGFLRDHNIMENYFGTDEEVAIFFNNVIKDVAFDSGNNYLSGLFKDVNEYYRNDWLVKWAGFKHTYFSTPWSVMSALAAVILLLLTIAQTFFTAYAYFRPPR